MVAADCRRYRGLYVIQRKGHTRSGFVYKINARGMCADALLVIACKGHTAHIPEYSAFTVWGAHDRYCVYAACSPVAAIINRHQI